MLVLQAFQRIPNVCRIARVAKQRSNPWHQLGGKRPFDPNIMSLYPKRKQKSHAEQHQEIQQRAAPAKHPKAIRPSKREHAQKQSGQGKQCCKQPRKSVSRPCHSPPAGRKINDRAYAKKADGTQNNGADCLRRMTLIGKNIFPLCHRPSLFSQNIIPQKPQRHPFFLKRMPSFYPILSVLKHQV